MIRVSRCSIVMTLVALALAGCGGNEPQSQATTAVAREPNAILITIHPCQPDDLPRRGMDNPSAQVSRSGRDFVAWYNGTGAPVTITFTGTWPFAKPDSNAITIGPFEASPFFRVDKDASEGDHLYETVPSYHPCAGEGEPAIVVGG